MAPFPHPAVPWRPPRLRLSQTTPAVLRVVDGRRVRGKLQVISVTGGLLCLSSPLRNGCEVKLMFLTDAGTVLGTAEMLPSLSGSLQPFRFVSIGAEDARRLKDMIDVSVELNRVEQQAIVKDRSW
jgi:hypothetical protein